MKHWTKQMIKPSAANLVNMMRIFQTPLCFAFCSLSFPHIFPIFFLVKSEMEVIKYYDIIHLYQHRHSNLRVNYIELAHWIECSPMVRETWVQSQVKSYQRLKKWNLMPQHYKIMIKGKVEQSSSYWRGSLRATID